MQHIPPLGAGLPFAPHAPNAAPQAAAPVADDLIHRSAHALMVLPAAIRATIPLCHDSLEATACALTDLTHPHGLPQEAPARRERFATAINRLNQARQVADDQLDLPLEDVLSNAIRLLRKCENRVEYECDIHDAGTHLRAHGRNADALLTQTEFAWRASEQRRQPVAQGGAPVVIQFIQALNPAQQAALETATQEALAAPQLNAMLQPLARISMTLANSLGPGSRFAGWFAARALLEARLVSAIGLNGPLITELRQPHGNHLAGWQHALSTRVRYLSRNTEDVASFVAALTQRSDQVGQLNDLAAMQLPPLPPLNPPPDPNHVDPEWNDAVTPPGSPQH